MYVNNWLTRRAYFSPEKVALVDTTEGNRRITYREWNHRVNRTANFLRGPLAVERGDRVAVLAMNCVEYLDLWFACGKIGAVIQLLNWRLTPRELEGLVADATPGLLVYGQDFDEAVGELRGQAACVKHFAALAEPQAAADVAFDDRLECSDGEPPEVDLEWEDPWAICYTGGTTGFPKGAVLTHRSITANSVNTVVSWGLSGDDVAILQMPLFHTGGFNVFTAPLVHVGGTSIVCRSFDLEQTFDLIRDHAVSLLVGVPTMYIVMQQHPRWPETDFSRVKICGSGGASCPEPVIERFRERGVDLFTGYGLTEAGPNNFWMPPEERRGKPGAVGYPLFHVDVRIEGEDGRECGPDEVGELKIRGPHVCAGYWNRPDESAAAIGPGGWLRTGDLARRDADGCHWIVGREKDMIKSGGENIYPAEVESVLHEHPAVAEAALVGVADDTWGEVGRAFVVLRQGCELSRDELVAFCGERLARFKIPKTVVFATELPKTAAGKVDKKRLTEAPVT
ncbi:MAG TPA: long-chain fatty acid--CoA ligase [Candidatus Sulfomarinibacteraceae bacterium]|nr:long-chain fatty acid--CoA ligase [Candidatus Sulfomarinibacteraceae bacterium]